MQLNDKWLRSTLITLIALLLGLAGALAIAAVLGEGPLKVLTILIVGSLGSPTTFGYSLYYATPILMTGLAVSWAFRAGLFNVGADGQMALGGLAMAAVGILWPHLPSFVALPFALSAGFVVGGVWGAIAGWAKAKRGCHEVLATILLSFIAYGLSSFVILSLLKNPESQVPETAPVGEGYQIFHLGWLGGSSPLNASIFISLLAVGIYAVVFSRTRLGFYQKLAGGAAEVGRRAGINMERQVILAMFISGGLAGLAAASPVLGFAYKCREGFVSGAGFVGIVVALLGRNSPLGLILSALLFGILTKGALDLDLDTEFVSRDLATVIQALIVLAVASSAGLASLFERLAAQGSSRRMRAQGVDHVR